MPQLLLQLYITKPYMVEKAEPDMEVSTTINNMQEVRIHLLGKIIGLTLVMFITFENLRWFASIEKCIDQAICLL